MIINQVVKGGGTQPTGTKNITANGVYDVTDFASADVQVPTTAPSFYIQKKVDTHGNLVPDPDAPIMNFSNVKTLGAYSLASAYELNNNSAAVDMSNIHGINDYSLYHCFYNSKITSLDLSSLQSIAANRCLTGICFQANYLTNVDISGITYIGGEYAFSQAFAYCTALTNIDLTNLQQITGSRGCSSMFYGCTGLTSADLSSLTTASGNSCMEYMFGNCTSLRSVDLSSLVNISHSALGGIFEGCTSLETVILNDALTTRDPQVILGNTPISNCMYADKLEYITISINSLCQGNHFSSANMKKFELVNITNTNMFANNTYLENIEFPVLTRWNGSGNAAGMFQGCTNANFTDIYFPMLCVFRNTVPFTTTSFPNQLTVHFRKDQQTLIQSTTGASSNFGAAALVFDQIGTITVGGTNYVRQGKCNETGYYAWQRASSNITVGGVVYTLAIEEITRNTVPVAAGPILYGWKNGSTTIFTDSLKPQVGDYIWTAFNVAQSTTPVDAVDNEFIYTEDSAEPDIGDTVYSDAQGTVLGTIDAVA